MTAPLALAGAFVCNLKYCELICESYGLCLKFSGKDGIYLSLIPAYVDTVPYLDPDFRFSAPPDLRKGYASMLPLLYLFGMAYSFLLPPFSFDPLILVPFTAVVV